MSKKSKYRARHALPQKSHEVQVNHASKAEEFWEPVMMAWSFMTTAGLIVLSGYISVQLLGFDAYLVASGAARFSVYCFRFLEVLAGFVETCAIARQVFKHFPAVAQVKLKSLLDACLAKL